MALVRRSVACRWGRSDEPGRRAFWPRLCTSAEVKCSCTEARTRARRLDDLWVFTVDTGSVGARASMFTPPAVRWTRLELSRGWSSTPQGRDRHTAVVIWDSLARKLRRTRWPGTAARECSSSVGCANGYLAPERHRMRWSALTSTRAAGLSTAAEAPTMRLAQWLGRAAARGLVLAHAMLAHRSVSSCTVSVAWCTLVSRPRIQSQPA